MNPEREARLCEISCCRRWRRRAATRQDIAISHVHYLANVDPVRWASLVNNFASRSPSERNARGRVLHVRPWETGRRGFTVFETERKRTMSWTVASDPLLTVSLPFFFLSLVLLSIWELEGTCVQRSKSRLVSIFQTWRLQYYHFRAKLRSLSLASMRQIYRFDRTIGSALVDVSATTPERSYRAKSSIFTEPPGSLRGFVNHETHGYLSCIPTHTHTHSPAAEFKRLTGAVSRE